MIGEWTEIDDAQSRAGYLSEPYRYFSGGGQDKQSVLRHNLEMCRLLGLPEKFAYEEEERLTE